jgi:hypothetical protein
MNVPSFGVATRKIVAMCALPAHVTGGSGPSGPSGVSPYMSA